MDLFILIDGSGEVTQTTNKPLLSKDSYPTVVKVSGYGDRGYCDDYDVEAALEEMFIHNGREPNQGEIDDIIATANQYLDEGTLKNNNFKWGYLMNNYCKLDLSNFKLTIDKIHNSCKYFKKGDIIDLDSLPKNICIIALHTILPYYFSLLENAWFRWEKYKN